MKPMFKIIIKIKLKSLEGGILTYKYLDEISQWLQAKAVMVEDSESNTIKAIYENIDANRFSLFHAMVENPVENIRELDHVLSCSVSHIINIDNNEFDFDIETTRKFLEYVETFNSKITDESNREDCGELLNVIANSLYLNRPEVVASYYICDERMGKLIRNNVIVINNLKHNLGPLLDLLVS